MSKLAGSEGRKLKAFIEYELDKLGLTENSFIQKYGANFGLSQTTLGGVRRKGTASYGTLVKIAEAFSLATGRRITAASLVALKDGVEGEELEAPPDDRTAADAVVSGFRHLSFAQKVRISPELIRLAATALECASAEPMELIRILVEAERERSGLGSEAFANSIGADPEIVGLILRGASPETIGADLSTVQILAKSIRDLNGNYGNLGLFSHIVRGFDLERLARMLRDFMEQNSLETQVQLVSRLFSDAGLDPGRLSSSQRREIQDAVGLILSEEVGLDSPRIVGAMPLIAESLGFSGDVRSLLVALQSSNHS